MSRRVREPLPLYGRPLKLAETFQQNADVVLYHGDCLELLGKLPNGFARLIVTSPPYNIGKRYERRDRKSVV